jgi:hypothetical protein
VNRHSLDELWNGTDDGRRQEFPASRGTYIYLHLLATRSFMEAGIDDVRQGFFVADALAASRDLRRYRPMARANSTERQGIGRGGDHAELLPKTERFGHSLALGA